MSSPTEKLCLSCTLCCNGGLFADLRLSAADRARLARKSIALKLTRAGKLPQPCQALCGPRCTIYNSRPGYCRRFECLLLKQVNAGAEDAETALGIIRTARRRLARVERLLRALGDQDNSVAVSLRFRRLSRVFATKSPDAPKAALFGELTLAIHGLNHYLAERFYPGP